MTFFVVKSPNTSANGFAGSKAFGKSSSEWLFGGRKSANLQVRMFVRNSGLCVCLQLETSSNSIWHWCPLHSEWQRSERALKKYLLEMNPAEKLVTGSFVNHKRRRRKISRRNCVCWTQRRSYGHLTLANYSYSVLLWCPRIFSGCKRAASQDRQLGSGSS